MTNYVRVAPVEDIPPGERLITEIDGQFIAVFNVDGTFHAILDVCTHDDGPVAEGELNGYEIECPRHGARFDIRDGRVLSFPAVTPVPWFATKVEDGAVYVDVGR